VRLRRNRGGFADTRGALSSGFVGFEQKLGGMSHSPQTPHRDLERVSLAQA
jgi:hypothetical protein